MCSCGIKKQVVVRPIVNTVVTNTVIQTFTNYSWYSNPETERCSPFYYDNGEFPCETSTWSHKYTRSLI